MARWVADYGAPKRGRARFRIARAGDVGPAGPRRYSGRWGLRAAIGIAAAFLGLAIGFAAFVVPARAARVSTLLVSQTLPDEETPLNLAVNQATHHFYVVSIQTFGGNAAHHIYNFEQGGQIDSVDPEVELAPSSAPVFAAVDNSGLGSEGYIYASGSGEVQQFDAAGGATGVTIMESSVPPSGTTQSGGLPPVVNSGTFAPRALAVDGSGDIFVVDVNAGAIDEFSSSGLFKAQLAAGELPEGTRGIALDSSGHIFVARAAPNGLGEGLFELDATTGECVQAGCQPIDPAPARGVAVDNAAGTVFTTGVTEGSGHGPEGRFTEYEASTGQLLGVTEPSGLHEPEGIAVDETSHEVIVVDKLPAREGTVDIFSAAKIVPDVTILAAGEVSDESAVLEGEIGAAGVPGATCVFQYADAETFAAHRFEGAKEAPCQPEGPFSGTAMNAVHADVSGLRGGTTYYVRLLGSNENGFNPGEVEEFTTRGPTIFGEKVEGVGETVATLKGTINPNGAASTTYRFEYLTQAAYEANPSAERFAGAIEVPRGGGTITETQVLAETINNLLPGTGYRFRIVAVGTGGPNAGVTVDEDIAFSTYAQSPVFGGCPNEPFRLGGPSRALPDCRAYEQVSPTDKNGANVEGEVNAVQASPNGEGITFFASTGIPGSEGEQYFPSYLATRAANGTGWSTQGLLPPASAGPRAQIVGWTEDLTEAYDFANQPTEGTRLLRRSNSDGSLSEVGRLASSQVESPFALAGTSATGAVALLEAEKGGLLPGDLTGKQSVYVYDRETRALVLAGKMNNGTVPPEGAMAGPYDWYGSGNPSAIGGSRRSYFTQAGNALSTDGTKVFFTAAGTGQLYVRVNPLAQQSAMSGEDCTEAATKACTIRISAPESGFADPETPAAFLAASGDGTLVYFLDHGKLTKDASGGSGYDLYRYDLETGELTDISIDGTDQNGARVEGMLGVSESGEDAYFVAAGALTGEANQTPNGETNLYSVHGDQVHFVARLGTGPVDALNWIPRSRTSGNSPVPNSARLSPDGQTLLFRSARQLTPYDNEGVAELYLYRPGTGIRCISCNPTGEPPIGPSGVQEIPSKALAPKLKFAIMTQNLTSDGHRVLFDSADRLVAADHNGVSDVYEWEEPNPGEPLDSCTRASSAFVASSGGCLFLLSGGAAGAEPSYFADANRDGRSAFIFTAQRLVAQDKDELIDVYDARVIGGIASQEAVPSIPCEGEEGCRPSTTTPPTTSTPKSPTINGFNVKPRRPCKKGKVRRHGKCAPKNKRYHHHRNHHHHKKQQGPHHGKGNAKHSKGAQKPGGNR